MMIVASPGLRRLDAATGKGGKGHEMQKLSRNSLAMLPPDFETQHFDPARVTAGIVHIGVGGFHRAHMARYTHDLMGIDEGALAWGITGAGLREADWALLEALTSQDCLFTLTEREGEASNRVVVASVASVVDASCTTAALLSAIENPRTRIVSMTVTSSGYGIDAATKVLDLADETVAIDLAGRHLPRSIPGILVEGYRRRWASGGRAFTALSCDNIQHNGDVLKSAVLTFAERLDPELAIWIEANASFPNSMVDRITPVPVMADRETLMTQTGMDDAAALSAELFRQWVIEDRFSDGRPAWDLVGAQFVDDVTPYEVMKLRLLNGSHLAIASLGQLSGYETIGEAIADPMIRRYMVALMDRETGPTLSPVPGVDLASYKRTLVARFSNPAIRDTTQRVNTDAPVAYLLDAIRDRLAADQPIDLLGLAIAAWLRRVQGTDDAGRPIKVVHPLAQLLVEKAGEGGSDPRPLLSITSLFGSLGQDPRLQSAVEVWLGAIYRTGVQATLRDAASRELF